MNSFVAIDVETANHHPTSICSVGAVKVEDGVITDKFYTLVHPYPNFYFRRFTEEVHGLSRADTDSAPDFAAIHPALIRFIGGLPLVAHNARFDAGCLRATATHYGLPFPSETFLCTLRAAQANIPKALVTSHSLPYVAQFLGIPFNNHHNALADAEACAKIAMTLL